MDKNDFDGLLKDELTKYIKQPSFMFYFDCDVLLKVLNNSDEYSIAETKYFSLDETYVVRKSKPNDSKKSYVSNELELDKFSICNLSLSEDDIMKTYNPSRKTSDIVRSNNLKSKNSFL